MVKWDAADRPRLRGAGTILPGSAKKFALAGKGLKSIEVRVHNQHDIPATAAIAAIGPAAWDVFFAPKMDDAIAAIARADADNCFVEVHKR